MTDRQNAIFYYFNLQKQSREWMTGIEIEKIDDKYLKNKILDAKEANDKLIKYLELRLSKGQDRDYVEQFWDDSEVFSNVLDMIRKEPDVRKKQELYLIMKEYSKGELKIIEDGQMEIDPNGA